LYIRDKLKKANIDHHIGEGNFVLIKCKQSIVEKLRDSKILVKGNFTHPLLKDYIRVTIGDVDSMKTFWSHFKEYLND
jgi:histidinol-phosphate/aromatic aminotransferase/cobyric acid decarboxylase-like protein